MSHPCREEIAFLEAGHIWARAVPRRLADLKRPVPQNYVYGVGLVLQILIKILSFHHELFRFLIWTDRQTLQQSLIFFQHSAAS
jgi:hypothetical protein